MRRTMHNSLTADVQDLVAIYARVSDPEGGSDDKYSISEQERLCKEWVTDKGKRVYDVFRDIGGKGDDLHRPGLERLRREMRAGNFGTIVVNEYDRFSRDSGITSILLHEAREHDVQIVFVQDPDVTDSTPMGRLLLWFKSWKAEQEHSDIRERTQRGLRARARQGKLIPGSYAQYGYLYGDPKKTHYVIDDETGPVVQRIFHDFVGGKSARQIADELDREGIVSPGRRAQLKGWAYSDKEPLSSRWRVTSLRRLLQWPGYTGNHAAYRHSVGFAKRRDELTGEVRKVHRTHVRSESDEKYIPLPEGVCPPLVSQEIWDAAQERFRVNKEQAIRNNKNPDRFLLRSGFVLCGHCGHALHVHRMNGDYAYRCDNRVNDRIEGVPCRGGGSARQTILLDREVWSQIRSMLQDSEHIRDLYDGMTQGSQRRKEDVESTLRAVEASIAELRSSNDNLLARIERLLPGKDDDVIAMYEQRVASNGRKLRNQEARLRELTETLHMQASKTLTVETFDAWARDVLPYLDELPMQTKRILMNNLGVKVVVWRHTIKPRFVVLFGFDETLASFAHGDTDLRIFTSLDAVHTVQGEDTTWAELRHALQERLEPVLSFRAKTAAIKTRSSWET